MWSGECGLRLKGQSVAIIEVVAPERHSSFLGYDNCQSVIGGTRSSDDPGFFGPSMPLHDCRKRQHLL
jgi:hypothetical protein